MGEPALPTPADRKATHELARAIVEAVRNDEPMPLPFQFGVEVKEGEGTLLIHPCRDDVEDLVFQLAQEIVLSSRVLWAACEEPASGDGVPACGWTGEMGQLVDRDDGVLRCPNCGSTAIKEDIVP